MGAGPSLLSALSLHSLHLVIYRLTLSSSPRPAGRQLPQFVRGSRLPHKRLCYRAGTLYGLQCDSIPPHGQLQDSITPHDLQDSIAAARPLRMEDTIAFDEAREEAGSPVAHRNSTPPVLAAHGAGDEEGEDLHDGMGCDCAVRRRLEAERAASDWNPSRTVAIPAYTQGYVDPENGKQIGSFTTYVVNIFGSIIRRRYSDFEYLHAHFERIYPFCVVPPIPEKQSINRTALPSSYLPCRPSLLTRQADLSLHTSEPLHGLWGRRHGLGGAGRVPHARLCSLSVQRH